MNRSSCSICCFYKRFTLCSDERVVQEAQVNLIYPWFVGWNPDSSPLSRYDTVSDTWDWQRSPVAVGFWNVDFAMGLEPHMFLLGVLVGW